MQHSSAQRKTASLHRRAFLYEQVSAVIPVPYNLNYIQTDRNKQLKVGDPELTYIYSFFAPSSKYNCSFKYIVRAELYCDCFAIKYYCARNKHSEYKYSRVLDFFTPVEAKIIMEVCASVIPLVLKKHPHASFAFNGSRTFDRKNYIEGPDNTQRYRIYVELVRRLFGEQVFDISQYDTSSVCLFINRAANPDIEAAKNRIYRMFAEIYEVAI